jgi:hypothetical protein
MRDEGRWKPSQPKVEKNKYNFSDRINWMHRISVFS